MSDSAEKQFEATPRRILKARREGNVARSSELAANGSFAAAAVTLVAIAPIFAGLARNAIRASILHGPSSGSALLITSALAVVAAAAFGGTITACVQGGGFNFVGPSAKLSRLDPIGGLKRILSVETLAHSLRAGLAFLFAALAMVPAVMTNASALLGAVTAGEAASATWLIVQRVAAIGCAVGFVFAIGEHAAARRLWLAKLRMSVDERKREAKEEEGDATARGRRRSLHRALLRSGMRRLKEAAFVVANPQHVAVALEYRPPAVPVPRVLVLAADAAAIRVRALAERYRIPVVENVTLARSLYRDARVGEPIPHAHYVAVAEVVAALMRVKAS